jgi:hypothetical protein
MTEDSLTYMPVGSRAPARRIPKDWAQDLADEISNRYQLGLNDLEARQLSRLIRRRIRDHLSE